MSTSARVIVACLMACAAGCLTPQIVAQARPNPFVGQRRFQVRPIARGHIRIVDETSEIVGGPTTTEELADWGRLDESFRNLLHARGIDCNFIDEPLAPPAPFTIETALVLSVTTDSVGASGGWFPLIYPTRTTRMRLHVRILDGRGARLDELELEARGNLADCICEFARQLANYLKDRSTG